MLRYFFPVLLIVAACSSNETSGEKKDKTAPVVITLANESEMDARRTAIDSIVEKAGLIASSLSFARGETGESIQVDGHMDTTNTILRLEEFFNDGNGKNSGRRQYYLNNGKPFLIREEFDDVSGTKPQFVDRITYYNAAGKALKTKERRADYQDLIEGLSYKPVPLVSTSMARAMRVMNQEGEFQTTFQGFTHADVLSYLIVGENKPDGFHSALRLDYKDPMIVALSANEDSYMGTLLRVQYMKEQDSNGFEYQVYAGGEFVEE